MLDKESREIANRFRVRSILGVVFGQVLGARQHEEEDSGGSPVTEVTHEQAEWRSNKKGGVEHTAKTQEYVSVPTLNTRTL